MPARPIVIACLLSACLQTLSCSAAEQKAAPGDQLDQRVKTFLDSREGKWRDMNVPEQDGKTLHGLILKHRYTRALEIGTSTGYSGIWMAWALAKTGGRLTTIEIDEQRHKEAVANFREAGLADYVDARLADAHELVPKLQGPFDFVFADADKEWSQNYMTAVLPKMTVGGCYVTHNVSDRLWRRWGWVAEYVDFLKRQPNLETTYDYAGGGMSISYKRK